MTAALLSAAVVVAIGSALRPRATSRYVLAEGEHGGAVGAPLHRSIPREPRHGSTARRRECSRPDPVELAAWCDAIARALRGGATFRHALIVVEPPASIAAALEPIHHALDRGAGLRQALDAVESAPHHLDLVLVVLRACAEHGGAPAEPIDRAAAALRQRAAIAAERRSQSAQARMSAVVMTALPGVMLAVLVTTSAAVRAAVATPLGLATVSIGAVSNVVGWRWMRRLITGGGPWG